MNKHQTLVAFAMVSTILVGLTGCATYSDPVKSGSAHIRTQDSENTNITNAHIRQRADEVLIHVDVMPKEPVKFFYPGHLRFVATDASGGVLFDLDVKRYTRGHHRHGVSKMKHASFWVRLPMNLPEGSNVTVEHHEGETHTIDDEPQGQE